MCSEKSYHVYDINVNVLIDDELSRQYLSLIASYRLG